MPVGEMLRRMTSRELTEWAAFFEIENEEAELRRVMGDAQAQAAAMSRALSR